MTHKLAIGEGQCSLRRRLWCCAPATLYAGRPAVRRSRQTRARWMTGSSFSPTTNQSWNLVCTSMAPDLHLLRTNLVAQTARRPSECRTSSDVAAARRSYVRSLGIEADPAAGEKTVTVGGNVERSRRLRTSQAGPARRSPVPALHTHQRRAWKRAGAVGRHLLVRRPDRERVDIVAGGGPAAVRPCHARAGSALAAMRSARLLQPSPICRREGLIPAEMAADPRPRARRSDRTSTGTKTGRSVSTTDERLARRRSEKKGIVDRGVVDRAISSLAPLAHGFSWPEVVR